MKKYESLKDVTDDYSKKQLGTGEPLGKPTEGQGRNSDRYEEKRRRRHQPVDPDKLNDY